ncbi:hypothetical protein AVEN_197831-1 [Araneus ventricosus]|uniref:Uncharacterized protein n=1 Tax=Araneus ventricosus TaxID=182803 RepID=A0A4Y2WKR6_ARAVE|nr:hypothetical protein AVEN_197831-1 [Araneus ventricosus]
MQYKLVVYVTNDTAISREKSVRPFLQETKPSQILYYTKLCSSCERYTVLGVPLDRKLTFRAFLHLRKKWKIFEYSEGSFQKTSWVPIEPSVYWPSSDSPVLITDVWWAAASFYVLRRLDPIITLLYGSAGAFCTSPVESL